MTDDGSRTTPSKLRCRIRPQHAYALAHLLEVGDGAGDVRLLRVAGEVGVEGVLPRAAFDRARLELREVDVAERESREGAEEGARLVRRPEEDRRLDAIPGRNVRDASWWADQQEAGEVLAMVLDAAREDLRTVDF